MEKRIRIYGILVLLALVWSCAHKVTTSALNPPHAGSESAGTMEMAVHSPDSMNPAHDQETLIRDYASRRDLSGIFRLPADSTLTYDQIEDMDDRFMTFGAMRFAWRVYNKACPDTVNVMIPESCNPFPIAWTGADIILEPEDENWNFRFVKFLYSIRGDRVYSSNPRDVGLLIVNTIPNRASIKFPPNNSEEIRCWVVGLDMENPSSRHRGPYQAKLFFVQPSSQEYNPAKIPEKSDPLLNALFSPSLYLD